MGILDKFNQSESNQIRKGTREGKSVTHRAGSWSTSQIHAQGNIGEEAPGFGKVNAGFIASTPEEASNLSYKKGRSFSDLDLDGGTPEKYENNQPR